MLIRRAFSPLEPLALAVCVLLALAGVADRELLALWQAVVSQLQ